MISEKMRKIGSRLLGKDSKFRGVLLLLLSTVLSSLSGLFCKLSSLNGVEISWVAGMAGTAMSVGTFCVCKEANENIFSKTYMKAFFNGLCLRGFATYIYYIAMDYITATDALVVCLFVSIVWATILEAIRLRSRPHSLAVVSAVVGLTGMILMCKPEQLLAVTVDLGYFKGVLFAAISGVFSATYYVNVHKLDRVSALWHWAAYPTGLIFLTKPEITINHFALSGCSLADRLFGVLAALLGIISGLIAIKGTQLTLASVSFVLKLFGIVLTFVLQVILLPNPVSLNSILGGLCIVVAMVLQFAVLSLRGYTNRKSTHEIEV